MSVNTIFSEITIAGWTVKPWSLGKLVNCSEPLARIIENAEKMDLDLGPIFSDTANAVQGVELKIALLITVSLPAVQDIMAATFDVPVAEMGKIDLPTAIKIAKAIFTVNQDQLKNSFAPPAVDPAGAKTTES
jgi:hypothetical protein